MKQKAMQEQEALLLLDLEKLKVLKRFHLKVQHRQMQSPQYSFLRRKRGFMFGVCSLSAWNSVLHVWDAQLI